MKETEEIQSLRRLYEQYALDCADAGLSMDHAENLLSAGVILQKKQLEFCKLARECDKLNGPKFVMIGGGRGPLALGTKILTDDGFKTMGEMQVGDAVFDETGAKCRVTGVSEVFTGRPCYEIEFDTGERIVADSVHEWMTTSKAEQKAIDRRSDEFREKRRTQRRKFFSRPDLINKNVLPSPPDGTIKTTEQIASTVRIQSGREVNHRIRACGPLQMNHNHWLCLEPYLLGLWLGDGNSDCGIFTTVDDLHLEFAVRGFEVVKLDSAPYRYSIHGLYSKLRMLGVLEDKHIPEHYFSSSQQQRIDLIRGLMDTDGCCYADGRTSFCNTNIEIASGFLRLLRSLGVVATMKTGKAKLYGRITSDCHHVHFSSWFNPFNLKRKADRWKLPTRKTTKNHYIISVTPVPSVPVRCITVNSPSHLFLCGESLVATHNSSKSHGIISQIFCDDCRRVPGLKVLFVRKVGKANVEQINDFRTKLLMNIPHKYKAQEKVIEFENGSKVILGNFKDEKDLDQYLGLEYDLIYIMESNQLTQTKKMNVLSCLRTNKTNWRPRCYEDTNPGGINHASNKRMYVDPWKEGKETETRYVHSTIDDNKFVDPEYKKYLEKLVGWQREAWLHGSWEFMAGAYFSNFSPDINVYPNEQTQLNERAVTRWFAGLDYGFTHPNAFVLACEDESGRVFVVGTYSQSNTVIQEHAANIHDLLALHHLEVSDLEFIAAGKDCFHVDKDGGTVATEYMENGIMLTPVHINRVNAWGQVAELIGDMEHGVKPKLFIHRNCEELIHQIRSAQCDPKKPNDILKMNANPDDGSDGDDLLESCFDGETRITTHRGDVAISSVIPGDMVLTSCGWRKVLAAEMTGVKNTVEYRFSNGTKLISTPEHRVWTDKNGWVRIDSLRNGDTVSAWLKKPSYSTESNSGVTQTLRESISGAIISLLEITGRGGALSRFIVKYGSRFTAQYRMDFTYTTKTKTRSTTPYTISNCYLQKITLAENTKRSLMRECWQTSLASDHSLLNGTRAKNAASSQKETTQLASASLSLIENTHADIAARNSSADPRFRGTSNTATPTAKKRRHDLFWKLESVASAGNRLTHPEKEKPKLAAVSVVSSRAGGRRQVYNLTVEGCPEYLAEGILVHNCRNALVLAYSSLLSDAKPVQMGGYTGQTAKQIDAGGYIDIEAEIRAADEEQVDND